MLAFRGDAAAEPLDDLTRTIESDRSEKARIAAVVALGKLGDRRSVQTLERALGDASPLVRSLAATALGHLGDAHALPALLRAVNDDSDSVRARAQAALARFRTPLRIDATEPLSTQPRKKTGSPRLHVVVKPMANTSPLARHLTARMRELVLAELATDNEISLDGEGSEGEQFIVDGSITRLVREQRGPWIEIVCEVKLTVSNGRGSLLSIVSGGATVQTARKSFRQSKERDLQIQALDHAIRGIQRDLLGFLSTQLAAK